MILNDVSNRLEAKKSRRWICGIAFLSATLLSQCADESETKDAEVKDTASDETEEADDPMRASLPLGRFENDSNAVLRYPARIAVGLDGVVYLSDTLGNQVLGFRDGAPVMTLSGLDNPLGIAIHGDRLYVGNHGRHNVEIFDVKKREVVGVLGKGEGEIEMPNAIATGPDGVVYVVDSKADQVSVFHADGKRLFSIGESGSKPGQLRFPSAVAVDQDRIVVGDQGNHRLQIFDLEGKWLSSVGEEAPMQASSLDAYRGRFTRVQGLALMQGEIFVLDSYHGHVQVFDTNGISEGFIGRMGDCSNCVMLSLDIAFDSNNNLLATDPERRRWVELPIQELR